MMKKIISLFKRNYKNKALAYDEINEGAEWVLEGEGIATRKYDGTCCMIKDGKLYKRYDCKKGKTPPFGFIAAQEPDEITGHWPGWIECQENNPTDKYHYEAFDNYKELIKNCEETELDVFKDAKLFDGTYELCGPKVNGNNEKLETHILIRHGKTQFMDFPREFEKIKKWLSGRDMEGVVWHHNNGNMVKIKKSDFGMKRDE